MKLHVCKNNHWFVGSACPHCDGEVSKTFETRQGDCIECGTLCPEYGYACGNPAPLDSDAAEYVWYASYGSNLSRERFMCYIEGGVIPGNDKIERGAKDKTPPIKDSRITFKHGLYFSKGSNKWFGSGVAFVDYIENDEAHTYGRMYLITKEQFFDVVRQENTLPEDAIINLDEEELRKEKSLVVFPDKNYGRILYLGDCDGYPIYSFTSVKKRSQQEEMRCFGPYYEIIAAGLKETYELDDDTIEQYMGKYSPN